MALTIKKSFVLTLCLANFFVYGETLRTKIEIQLHNCARIHQDMQRLSCFDALTMQSNKLPTIKLTLSKNTLTHLPTKKPLNKLSRLKVRPKTQPSIVKKQRLSMHKNDNLSSSFGQVSNKINEPNKPKSLDSVEFVVKSAKLSLRKHWRLTFNNGQVWQAIKSNNTIKFKINNIIVIKRGFLNSFHLKKKGKKRSLTVKRIK